MKEDSFQYHVCNDCVLPNYGVHLCLLEGERNPPARQVFGWASNTLFTCSTFGGPSVLLNGLPAPPPTNT
jgi:hypothetical protein